MKKTSTEKPIVPKGYTGKDFNPWQRYIQKQVDKIKATTVAERLMKWN